MEPWTHKEVFTKSTMHRLLMRGDPVTGKRNYVSSSSVVERILANTHFETPKRIIAFGLGPAAARAHQVETYSVDRDDVREVIQRGVTYVAYQPLTNVVLAAFAAFMKQHPTRILMARARARAMTRVHPWRPAHGKQNNYLMVPSFVDPLTGRVDTMALALLLRGMQHALFANIVDNAAHDLDVALAKDVAHRSLLAIRHLSPTEYRVWHAIVDQVEREPLLFNGSYDERNDRHRRIMRMEVLARPLELVSAGLAPVDIEQIAPNIWAYLRNTLLPKVERYALRHNVAPLVPRDRLPPLHNQLLMPVTLQVDLHGTMHPPSPVEATVRREPEPLLLSRVEPTVLHPEAPPWNFKAWSAHPLQPAFWSKLGTLLMRYLEP